MPLSEASAAGWDGLLDGLEPWLEAERDRMAKENARPKFCAGFGPSKRLAAMAFLSAPGAPRPVFCRSAEEAADMAGQAGGECVLWASSAPEWARDMCRDAGAGLVLMEDGFLRSNGLGIDFALPWSLILDRDGFHCDPSRPSRLEHILNGFQSRPDAEALRLRARRLAGVLKRLGMSKYGAGGGDARPALPEGRRIVLVPGQAEDDASVRLGCPGVKTNLELLEAAREAEPDAFVIWKPHPDCFRGRPGLVADRDALRFADLCAPGASIDWLLKRADCVCTLSSTAGFEALLRGVPKVRCFGAPWYAGWGLTEDAVPLPRRHARLAVDELAAGALLLAPSYWDWESASFVLAEHACFRLAERAAGRGRRMSLSFAPASLRLEAGAAAAWRLARRKVFGMARRLCGRAQQTEGGGKA